MPESAASASPPKPARHDSASLKCLAGAELETLAGVSRLPAELRTEVFRASVLSEGAVQSFVEVLVAEAGANETVTELVTIELARMYEQRTGETSRLALGPINLVADDLYGPRQADSSFARVPLKRGRASR